MCHLGMGVHVVSSSFWGGGMTRTARHLVLADVDAPVASPEEIQVVETYWAGLSELGTPPAIRERWPQTWAARAALPAVQRSLVAIQAARRVSMRGAWHINDQERALVAAIVSGEAVEIPPLLDAPSEEDVTALQLSASQTQRRDDWLAADEARDRCWAAMARQDQRDALLAGCAAAGIPAVS